MKIHVDDCESLFIEVNFEENNQTPENNRTTKKTVLVGCVYRHPRWLTTLFIESLCSKLIESVEINIPVIVMGDFNINTLGKSDRE